MPPSDGAGVVVELAPGGRLDVAREAPVVAIPVYGQPALFERCLRSVLRHTPPDVPIVVADDASPDGSPAAVLRRLAAEGLPRDVHFLRQPRNLGFPRNVNSVFEAASPGDVVLLNSDTEVGPEWLERLRAAARSDTLIATATALSNSGTIVSVPRGETTASLPAGHDSESAARAVAGASLQLRPRIPTAIGHCVYVRRPALELVGLFDPAFTPGYGEEVDFSQRCSLRGLVHVAADDVYVFHVGGASLPSQTQADHEQLIARRYPYYHSSVADLAERREGPLARALLVAEVALSGLSVTIDARCLGPTVTGTQVVVLELLRGIARSGRARVRALLPDSATTELRRELDDLGVEVLSADDVPPDVQRTAIVHRPYQVAHTSELELLERLGERVLITHHDLIAFRTPGYARSARDWHEFRRLTRAALALADLVLFVSRHAAEDAFADELVPPERALVVYNGVDHVTAAPVAAVRPELPAAVDEHPFLLYIGTDFNHKNRLFALRLLETLVSAHGWDGRLVFAGPPADRGTSDEAEAEFLREHRALAGRVVSTGSVSDAGRTWLYEHCAGVVYPSLYEGFGIIPFEAAAFDKPCFFAPQTALGETLPPACATLVPWDVHASAAAVHEVAGRAEQARALAAGIAGVGQRYRWAAATQAVLEAYDVALRMPSRDLRRIHDHAYASAVAEVGASVSELALPPEAHRALLSVLARPWLSRPLLGALRLAFRAGYLARHSHLPDERGI